MTASGVQWVQRVADALESGVHSRRVREVETGDFCWLEIDLHDEQYPVAVDVVASRTCEPNCVVYMLAGGGMNFRSSFFSPVDRNLAHFLRRQGALVVGISAREDRVPGDLNDYSFMASWGLSKHRADIRSVVARVQAAVSLPYDVIGHSYGAAYALDYAAHHASELRRVIALDIFSLPPQSSSGPSDAERTYHAHVQCLAERQYHDTSYSGLREAVAAAIKTPTAQTPYPREMLGYTGLFCAQGLLDFSLVHSRLLPGIHTPTTGLSGDWPLHRGHLAGTFQFAEDPRQDAAAFTHTSAASLREAASQVGGGLMPVAVERDYWAVNAHLPAYDLPWRAIETQVLWLNAELGYGNKQWGAELIRGGGNEQVQTRVIAGYGHADLLWGERAAADVWQHLCWR